MKLNESSLVEFNVKFELVNTSQVIRSDCNAITVLNTGTVNAVLNGVTLLPGGSFQVQGNELEIDRSIYNVFFDPAAVGTREVYVIRKQYK
jgi:hypothetical protein